MTLGGGSKGRVGKTCQPRSARSRERVDRQRWSCRPRKVVNSRRDMVVIGVVALGKLRGVSRNSRVGTVRGGEEKQGALGSRGDGTGEARELQVRRN